MSGTRLLLLQILAFIPLVVILAQVIMLRRILNSRAWTMIVLGFVVFVLMRGTLFFTTPPTWSLLVATFLGYALIIYGFHRLRKDLLSIMRITVNEGVQFGRRKSDPKPGPTVLNEEEEP